jgi:hypothetical protein
MYTLLDINPSRLMINTGVVMLREFRRWDSSHFLMSDRQPSDLRYGDI